MLLVPSSGYAVHDLGLFELDTTAPQYANTADNSGPGAPYDWESIFNSSGQQILTSATEPRLLTAEFNADSATPDESYFAESNKDIDDVSTWECKSVNNPTPKDEISNAYAALFLDADNHVILYAGGERDSNNGNSFMGFWIFKGAVGCNSPGNFSGQHTDGDVLILSNFTGGGTHPLVEVYEWDNGGLTLVDSGNFCHTEGAGDDVCGEVNGSSFLTAWAPHNDAANPLDANELLEIGVDLTDALDFATNTVPCFARFLAETRSSQETTATLKDYASGEFNTCTSSTVTTPLAGGTSVSGSAVIPGTSVTDQAVVTGSALVGTAPGPTGTVSFFMCGPQSTQALAQCTSGGDPVGSPVALSGSTNPATVSSSAVAPTAPGWYCFRAEYSGDTNYADGSTDSSLNECFQVAQATPTVTTDIHNAAHAIVTVVAAGSTVHDFVSVTGASGVPSGNVTIDWFTNGTCAGTPASTSPNVALDASGHADATSFPQGPLTAGMYGFKAHYLGDTIYIAGNGPCEPLQVVDAQIDLSPLNATNEVDDAHTITATVQQNDGLPAGAPGDAVTGFGPAPNGTLVTFSLLNNTAGAAFVGGVDTCTTTGGTCSVEINTGTAGSVDIHATTTFDVGGISLTRATGTGGLNSADANKVYVNAKITIAPDATNEVGQPHTFTVTLSKDTGTGTFGPAAGEHVSVTLTDSNGAGHTAPSGTCTNGTTDVNGQCTITFTSPTAGKVTGHASATLEIGGGATVTVATDGVAPNSGDAVKTFVDANIQITPATAINPVGTNHTLAGHVNVHTGSGGFVNAPNGTVISF
ncbi:MAG TPA: hypothetical protein VN960_12415, partial [Gaiellaceae bacterium]|nr:hypothetical protein [Gaiellaceae bacterium]